MREWIKKNYVNLKITVLLLTSMTLLLAMLYEFIFKAPDDRRVEIVCLMGHEYIYFAKGYKAGLASRWDEHGALVVCPDV